MADLILGDDIQLDLIEEDLAFGANNDFAIISGYDNLNQAIGMRIKTTLGTMLTHPTYGSSLPTLKGANQDEQTLSQAILYTYEALNAEPRVEEIYDVDAEFVNIDEVIYLQVSCSVKPINNTSTLTITVVIQ